MTLNIAAEPVPLRTYPDGTVRVADTRVTLDTLVGAFLSGMTPEEIIQSFPTLQLGDIYAVISFYLHHQEEVNLYLTGRQALANSMREIWQERSNPQSLREKLQSRLLA
jgi:uncharacterized protein (DUF433 family)